MTHVETKKHDFKIKIKDHDNDKTITVFCELTMRVYGDGYEMKIE